MPVTISHHPLMLIMVYYYSFLHFSEHFFMPFHKLQPAGVILVTSSLVCSSNFYWLDFSLPEVFKSMPFSQHSVELLGLFTHYYCPFCARFGSSTTQPCTVFPSPSKVLRTCNRFLYPWLDSFQWGPQSDVLWALHRWGHALGLLCEPSLAQLWHLGLSLSIQTTTYSIFGVLHKPLPSHRFPRIVDYIPYCQLLGFSSALTKIHCPSSGAFWFLAAISGCVGQNMNTYSIQIFLW